MRASKTDTDFPLLGLLTLAGAIFIAVTSEFLPTGLLPEMAEGLGVSQSSIGLLITVFAATVVATAAPLAAVTRRLPRKSLVVIVLITFAASNFLSAAAPSYEFMVVSRILGGVSHGLFWAVVGAYPGHLVASRHLARAVAITSAGGTAAFVLGVPAGTALGHALGWRLAFTVVGIVVLGLAALVVFFLPAVNHHQPLATGEIRLPLRKDPSWGGVILVCVIITLLMVGHNMYYTYIVPFFTEVNGFPVESVSVLLLVYGGAGAVGLLLVGVYGGRFPRAALLLSVVFVAVAVSTMALLPSLSIVVIIALVFWGAAFGGAPALLQTRMLQIASPQLRDVSAALVTTSFNIGIGGGALIGSLLLDGWGLWVLPFADLAVVIIVLALVLASDVYIRNRRIKTSGLI
ncbi:MAG: MFS transporter [Microbacteriaceae bacterium]|nr:MFS transporter [Microbacteriaceae bacterium]